MPRGGWEILTCAGPAILIYVCIPNTLLNKWSLFEYLSLFVSFLSSPLSSPNPGPASQRVHKRSCFQKSPWPWPAWLTSGVSSWLRAAGLGLEHVPSWELHPELYLEQKVPWGSWEEQDQVQGKGLRLPAAGHSWSQTALGILKMAPVTSPLVWEVTKGLQGRPWL